MRNLRTARLVRFALIDRLGNVTYPSELLTIVSSPPSVITLWFHTSDIGTAGTGLPLSSTTRIFHSGATVVSNGTNSTRARMPAAIKIQNHLLRVTLFIVGHPVYQHSMSTPGKLWLRLAKITSTFIWLHESTATWMAPKVCQVVTKTYRRTLSINWDKQCTPLFDHTSPGHNGSPAKVASSVRFCPKN